MSSQEHAPNFSLAGKVTVVTGASRGIGRACALACAAAGSDIVLGVRNPGKTGDLVAEIEAMGRKAIAVELDIPNKDHIAGVIKAAVDTFGRIDVLVNNVGVAPGDLAERVEESAVDEILNINIKGTFLMTQAVARHMIARKQGRIISISSQAGTNALQRRGDLLHEQGGDQSPDPLPRRRMGRAWHHRQHRLADLHPHRRHASPTSPKPENTRRRVDHIPLGRIGETSDVTGAVVFLASPAASLITGANLLVDGGWSVA